MYISESVHELEYICMCMCVHVDVFVDACSVLLCSCTGTRGCIDCSDLQIIAVKSDQQQPTEVKTSLTNRSPAALPYEATCLIVCGVL